MTPDHAIGLERRKRSGDGYPRLTILCRIGIHRFIFVPNDGKNIDLGRHHTLIVCRKCHKAMIARVT